ncbi:MAG: hypothetical protein IJ570_03825 [Prevotella sp.]|nr:hypothetical protein [Prevotella sp.]
MKKFTLLFFVAFLAMVAGAQPQRAQQLSSMQRTAVVLTTKTLAERQRVDLKGYEGRPAMQAPKKSTTELVTPPEDLVIGRFRLNGSVNISGWETVSRPIYIGFDGNDVYVQGFMNYLPEAWIKGTLNDDHTQVSFPMQFVGQLYNSNNELRDVYFWPATYATDEEGNSGWQPIDAVFNFNEELKTFVLTQDVVTYIFENTLTDALRYFAVYDSVLTITDDSDTVEVPDNLETVAYQFSGTLMDLVDESEWKPVESFVKSVNVAIDDEHIYIQGLCPYISGAWVKGDRQGDTFVLKSGQFFGTYIFQGEAYPIYFVPMDVETGQATDLVLTQDEQTGALTTEQWISLSAVQDDVYFYEIYADVELSDIPDVAATPATPEISYFEYDADLEMALAELSVPTVDVDGKPLITEKLYYQLFTDYGEGVEPYVFEADWHDGLEEDMTVVPYNYADDIDFLRGGEMILFYTIQPDLKRIGVKSIYTGGDETHESPVSWYLVDESYVPNDDVDDVTAAVELPEGLEPELYSMTAQSMFWGEPEDYSGDVLVAFDENNVYMQGLSTWVPEAWVRGTLSDGTITIPKRYMGLFEGYGIPIDVTFNGATFTYDAQAGTISSEEGYTTTASYEFYGESSEEDADVFVNVVIAKAADVAATPAAPEIVNFHLVEGYGYMLNLNIPLVDVDGNPIFKSKLSYQLYSKVDGQENPVTLEADKYEYATEDLSIIPYLYTDHWEVTEGGETVYVYVDGIEDWEAIGARSIYTGGGETRQSAITWKQNDWNPALGIEDAQRTSLTVQRSTFDLQGRQAASQAKGLVIVQTRRADGSMSTKKVVRR